MPRTQTKLLHSSSYDPLPDRHDLQEKRELTRKRLTEGGDGMDVFAMTAGPDGNI